MPTRLKRLVRFAREHLRELGFERRRKLVESLLQQLSVLTPDDLELPGAAEISSWPAQVYYKSVFHDQHLDVGVFLLPRGASIPLHDHPFMTVFSKVLYGNVRLQALDWCKMPAGERNTPCGAAQVVSGTLITADSPVLEVLPTRSNLHSIYAETDCAFIDLAIPPYGDERTCSYFDTLTCPEYASLCASQSHPALASLPLSFLANNMSLFPSATSNAPDAHDSDADPGSPSTTTASEPDSTVPRTCLSPALSSASSSFLPSAGSWLCPAARLPPVALLASIDQPPVLSLTALHVYEKSPSGSPSYAAQIEHQSHPSNTNPGSPCAYPSSSVSVDQPLELLGRLVGQTDPSALAPVLAYTLTHADMHESGRHSSVDSVPSPSSAIHSALALASLAHPRFSPHMCRRYPAGHVHLVPVASDFTVELLWEDGDDPAAAAGVPMLDPLSLVLAGPPPAPTLVPAAQLHPLPSAFYAAFTNAAGATSSSGSGLGGDGSLTAAHAGMHTTIGMDVGGAGPAMSAPTAIPISPMGG